MKSVLQLTPLIFALIVSLSLASPAHAHGDLHERIAALSAQISTNQNDATLWLQRADLERQHAEFSTAQTDLDHAAQLRPGWASVALQRARLAFDCGNFPATIRAAGDCLQLDPTNADAFVLRARSRGRLHQLEPAIADYDAVLNRTNAAAPLPDLFLERARAQVEIKNFAAASAGLDDAMRQFGETPSFALPAIEYDRQRGAFTNALARLERAEKFFDRESFLALRGEIHLQAGRTAEAAKDFSTALATLEKFSADRRVQSAALEQRLRAGLAQATVTPIKNRP